MKEARKQFAPLAQVKLSAADKADVLHELRQTMQLTPIRRPHKPMRMWRNVGVAAVGVLVAGALITSQAMHGSQGNHLAAASQANPAKPGAGLQTVSSTQPHMEATDKGITVRITSVFYDTHQLKFHYSISVPPGYKPLEIRGAPGPQANFVFATKLLNGKPLGGGGGGFDKLDKSGTYEGEIDYSFPSEDMPVNGMLTTTLHQIGNVHGTWSFAVPLTSAGLDRVWTPNASESFDGATLTVGRISIGTESTTIDYQLKEPVNADGSIKYQGANFNVGVFDEHHQILQEIQGGTPGHGQIAGGFEILKYSVVYHSHLKTPSRLSFEAVYTDMQPVDRTKHVIPYKGQFPIPIHSQVGTTTINKIDFLSDKTLVHVTLDPSTLEHPDFTFEDASGKSYERIGTEAGEIEVFPAMDPNKPLNIIQQAPNDGTVAIGVPKPIPGFHLVVPLQ